jgi:dTDP-4-dehydrorhamnose reductase
MKLTILLTGKTGQIGSRLYPLLANLGEVFAPDRNLLDLSDIDAIRRQVRDLRPNLIVNTAAYTAVDAAETDESSAYEINASAPAAFAEEASKIGAGIIHYSTDYVFDGQKRTPYIESDPTHPINAYGRTKLAGEQAIRDSGAPHLILRTSWIYATQGKNFLLTVLRLATERNELKIVRDQFGSPTCADEVAEATTKVLAYIQQGSNDLSALSEFSGTYHMTAGGEATWYDFANVILQEAHCLSCEPPWLAAATRGRKLIVEHLQPISSEEFHSPAARPAYSVLSNSQLTEKFSVALPDWQSQLRRCFVSQPLASATSSY